MFVLLQADDPVGLSAAALGEHHGPGHPAGEEVHHRVRLNREHHRSPVTTNYW